MGSVPDNAFPGESLFGCSHSCTHPDAIAGFHVRVDLFPEGDPVEFIQQWSDAPSADPVWLKALSLGLRMLDLVEFQVELIGMLICSSGKLFPPIGQDPQDRDLMGLKKGQHPIIEHVRCRHRNLGRVNLRKGHGGEDLMIERGMPINHWRD